VLPFSFLSLSSFSFSFQRGLADRKMPRTIDKKPWLGCAMRAPFLPLSLFFSLSLRIAFEALPPEEGELLAKGISGFYGRSCLVSFLSFFLFFPFFVRHWRKTGCRYVSAGYEKRGALIIIAFLSSILLCFLFFFFLFFPPFPFSGCVIPYLPERKEKKGIFLFAGDEPQICCRFPLFFPPLSPFALRLVRVRLHGGSKYC